MREKELRIALVCFGGVSLAVYMHGVTKEILKLLRASSALHAIPDRAVRARAAFFETTDRAGPGQGTGDDTEEVYFELLREIGHRVELRVDRRHRRRRVGRRHQRRDAGARAGT